MCLPVNQGIRRSLFNYIIKLILLLVYKEILAVLHRQSWQTITSSFIRNPLIRNFRLLGTWFCSPIFTKERVYLTFIKGTYFMTPIEFRILSGFYCMCICVGIVHSNDQFRVKYVGTGVCNGLAFDTQ